MRSGSADWAAGAAMAIAAATALSVKQNLLGCNKLQFRRSSSNLWNLCVANFLLCLLPAPQGQSPIAFCLSQCFILGSSRLDVPNLAEVKADTGMVTEFVTTLLDL